VSSQRTWESRRTGRGHQSVLSLPAPRYRGQCRDQPPRRHVNPSQSSIFKATNPFESKHLRDVNPSLLNCFRNVNLINSCLSVKIYLRQMLLTLGKRQNLPWEWFTVNWKSATTSPSTHTWMWI
jgi:hypothetical protein